MWCEGAAIGNGAGRRLRLACFLSLACLLAACTASFTYNNLDRLIPWYVDGYVDLSHDQREILRGQLTPLLQWHRQEELERYIAILDRVDDDLTRPVTAEVVQSWIDAVTVAAERAEVHMLQVALEFGATLSDEQMTEFTASLWERQRDYEEEFLGRSDAEYREESFENLRDFLARQVGRLDAAQQGELRSASARLQRFDAAWLEDRAAWLRRLEPLLQRETGWQAAVQAAYLERRNTHTPRYRETLRHNLDAINPAVASVLNSLSERQRAQAAESLDELRGRLRDLAD
jgi:uncharacterized protein (UPF0216 family)